MEVDCAWLVMLKEPTTKKQRNKQTEHLKNLTAISLSRDLDPLTEGNPQNLL